jgi:hypothetical protein
MIVIPFEPEHLNFLELQERQKIFNEVIKNPQYGIDLKNTGVAWSMFEESTLCCIGSAGIINAGFGRGIAWALMSKDAKNHMVRITREVKKRLIGFDRIEITTGFDEARRWAEILGFKCETPEGMKNYMGNETHYLYSRT